MKHHFLTLLVLLTLFFAACEPTKPVLTAGAGGMDMFSPVKMRLHPLSRVVTGDKAGGGGGGGSPTTVEARLEFTDQFGDVTKSPGTVYFEVFRYENFTPTHHGDRIDLHTFQLSSPEANKEHWDPITRTYLFHLPLPADSLKKSDTRLILSVTLNPDAGDATRLQDDRTLFIKQSLPPSPPHSP